MLRLPVFLFSLVIALAITPARAGEMAADRADMVQTIEDIAADVTIGTGRRPINRRVLDVMATVPRHAFVPDPLRTYAYTDRPLPIGHGQTISQPYIVALMTDRLEVDADDVVLEIGTGSGYQAAVLSPLTRAVYTIEIVEPLAASARERLAEQGYGNVTVRAGDGYYGWADHAPFDAIIVTAAAGHVPPPLIEQLKPGGRTVIPVRAPFTVHHLMLVHKSEAGEVRTEFLLPVAFVPLTGGH